LAVRIIVGDCREKLQTIPDQSVQCCVTSPPYFGLRDYGMEAQIGLEATPNEFVEAMVGVFREVRRVLRDDGTLWLNIGDSYARPLAKGGSGPGGKNREWYGDSYSKAGGAGVPDGLKPKDLIGIPWRVAFALQADGWWLRSSIIWHKPNPMPESVTDRPTSAHENVFLFAKSERYFYDAEAVREVAEKGAAGSLFHTGKTGSHQLGRSSKTERNEDGKRNLRNVWTIPTQSFSGAHFATFPPDLIEPCIKAGCPKGGLSSIPLVEREPLVWSPIGSNATRS